MRTSLLFAVVLLSVPVARAQAAPIPEPVAAMIVEAAKSPDDLNAVVKAAKATNPGSVAEIDALVGQLTAVAAAEHQDKLARATFFQNWTGTGQVGFSHTSGNTNDTNLSIGVDLEKNGLMFRHKFTAAADRQTSANTETADRYTANYQLDYKFSQRFYVYGLVGWDRDTFDGFTRRFSKSAGMGYSLIKTAAIQLDLTAGPGLRQTRFVSNQTENATTGRGGVDFNWKIRDGLTLAAVAGVFFDGTFTSSTALTTALSKKFSARVSFDVNHEEDTVLGRAYTDTATKVLLVYGF